MKDKEPGGIGKLSRKRLSKVIENTKGVINASNVSTCLQITSSKARSLLFDWVNHGWLKRIQTGTYLPVDLVHNFSKEVLVDPWSIAMQLFSPCYIGGWSACQYWDFTEQIFDTVVVLTTTRIAKKEQVAGNIKFFIKKITNQKFFGLKSIWKEQIKVYVSDPHKTIVDIFDNPSLGGGIRSVSDMLLKYLSSEHFDPSLILKHAMQVKNKTIFKRMGYLLSILNPDEKKLIQECQKNISKGYSQIDPFFKGTRIVKKWGLWIPEDFEKIINPNKK